MEKEFIDYLFIVAVILILIISWFFSKAQRTIRLFNSASFRNIKECKDNEVCKIQGELKLVSGGITAPLSGRKCAVYRIIVEEYRSSGRSGYWSEIIDDERKTSFVIQNNGQIALVTCSNAALLLHKDKDYESGTFNDATEKLNKYLESFDKESTNFLGLNKSIQYKEGVLEEGEEVSVYGSGEWKYTVDFEELKDFHATKVFVFKSTSKNPLSISDDIRILSK